MSKHRERKDEELTHEGKAEALQRRVILQAALGGPVWYQLVFLSFRFLFQSQLDLEPRDIPAWYTEYTQEQGFLWQSGRS